MLVSLWLRFEKIFHLFFPPQFPAEIYVQGVQS